MESRSVFFRGSMVYIPTFTIKNSTFHVGKYTSPMDGIYVPWMVYMFLHLVDFYGKLVGKYTIHGCCGY